MEQSYQSACTIATHVAPLSLPASSPLALWVRVRQL